MVITTVAINKYLDNMGVKHTYAGYKYLVEAIMLGAERTHAIGIMKIYDQIAQIHNTKSSLIERAIRSAITSFGLSNKEFISKAVDDIIYSPEFIGDYKEYEQKQEAGKSRIPASMECSSLDEVRKNIDRIDDEIVRLIYERQTYVIQASVFKKSEDEVNAPDRVEAVITKVRAKASELGTNPDMIEALYRKMISWFIDAEKEVFYND